MEGMEGSKTEPPPTDGVKDDSKLPTADPSAPAGASSPWMGWFSKSAVAEQTPISQPPSLKSPEPRSPLSVAGANPHQAAEGPSNPAIPVDIKSNSAKRTWYQMLSGSQNTEPTTEIAPQTNVETTQTEPSKEAEANKSLISGFKVPSVEASTPLSLPADGSKSAGWVFWSRDRPATSSSTVNEVRVGEIAVSDTPSQKRPKRTSISLKEPERPKPEPKPAKPVPKAPDAPETGSIRSIKAITKAIPKTAPKTPVTPVQDLQKTGTDGTSTPKSAKFPASESLATKQLQLATPNLLLPSFAETFSGENSPGLLQMLGRLLSYSKPSEDKHLHRTKDVPKLKTALAIGVHGFFPSSFFRTVLGQPTGTSIKFAELAAKAIRKWTNSRGYDCQVKTAALEGEGRILERVGLLWKLLLNWIDEIRKADFILVACHSQGVPVATMLVAKLVNFGCINSARVGICAMAGVSLGPFPELQSRWISGSAGELFEFSHHDSAVSKDYLHAVEVALKFGVRLVYIGSIDDQLVSLESSTFSPISHPHIYRAAFVDGRIHAPNFLVHLVGFALKLRNLGVQDHGLIRELSSPLAGSLYTGEGHSRIYEDDAVYDLAVEFSLETTAVPNTPLLQKPGPTQSSNPYILPWAVRGILEEEFVKSDLRDEVDELLRQFDDWKPTTKALKDVKFRLEGIRSKL